MAEPPSTPGVRRRLPARVENVLGICLIVLAVVSVVTLAYYIVEQQRALNAQRQTLAEQQETLNEQKRALEAQRLIIACHERYIDAFKTANLERAAAAAEDRDANRDLFVTAAQQAGDRQAQLEAFNEWLRRLEAADQRRSEHPLPTERCG